MDPISTTAARAPASAAPTGTAAKAPALKRKVGPIAAIALQAAMVLGYLGLGSTLSTHAKCTLAADQGARVGTVEAAREVAPPSGAVIERDGARGDVFVAIQSDPKAKSAPSEDRIALGSVGWTETSDRSAPALPVAIAGLYASLLGALAMARGAALKGKSRLESDQAARAAAADPTGFVGFMRAATEILTEVNRALASLAETRPVALLTLMQGPGFIDAPLEGKLEQLLTVGGPELETLATGLIQHIGNASRELPPSLGSGTAVRELINSDAFKKAPLSSRLAQLLEPVLSGVSSLPGEGAAKGQELKALFGELFGRKSQALQQLFQRADFQTATPEVQVAQLIDTLLGTFATKANQRLPVDDARFLGRVSAVSRSKLLPSLQADFEAKLASQGPQRAEDLASHIYNIGGERYQFDFSKTRHVASVGEVPSAIRVATGETVYFKSRKPHVTRANIEADMKFFEAAFALWVPTERRQQLEGYLQHLKQDILDQLNYGLEARKSAQFNEAYAASGFEGPKVFYVSPENDFMGMTQVPGIPFSDLSTLSAEERREAEVSYVRAMTAQLRRGLFHSDPQRDNVFWDASTRSVRFVDMGSVSTLSADESLDLMEHYLVMMTRDPKATAALLIRSADRITSALTPAELQTKLERGLSEIFARRDLSPAAAANRVRELAELNGVWSKTDRALLYQTLLTVSTTLTDPEVRSSVRSETMRSILSGMAEMARESPSKALSVFRNVAVACGRHPADFTLGMLELVRTQPRQLQALAERIEGVMMKLAPTSLTTNASI